MRRETFREQFTRDGRYQTPARPTRGMADRLLGWSNAWYYLRLFEVVTTGARLARRGLYTREEWINQSLRVWEIVEGCGGRIRLNGIRHIQNQPGPRVYACNHMSLLETFLMPGVLAPFDYTAVVVKEDLLTWPVFGPIMRAVEPISVTRRNVRQDLTAVMTQGRASLETGRSVLIFPQSTRARVFDPAQFNSMAAKLADRAGVPLTPIAVKTDFMGIGRLVKDFGRIDRRQTVHVEIGPPITVAGHVREAQKTAVDFITAHLRQWGAPVAPPGANACNSTTLL